MVTNTHLLVMVGVVGTYCVACLVVAAVLTFHNYR